MRSRLRPVSLGTWPGLARASVPALSLARGSDDLYPFAIPSMALGAASMQGMSVDKACTHEMVWQGNFGDALGDFALASRLHVT